MVKLTATDYGRVLVVSNGDMQVPVNIPDAPVYRECLISFLQQLESAVAKVQAA